MEQHVKYPSLRQVKRLDAMESANVARAIIDATSLTAPLRMRSAWSKGPQRKQWNEGYVDGRAGVPNRWDQFPRPWQAGYCNGLMQREIELSTALPDQETAPAPDNIQWLDNQVEWFDSGRATIPRLWMAVYANDITRAIAVSGGVFQALGQRQHMRVGRTADKQSLVLEGLSQAMPGAITWPVAQMTKPVTQMRQVAATELLHYANVEVGRYVARSIGNHRVIVDLGSRVEIPMRHYNRRQTPDEEAE